MIRTKNGYNDQCNNRLDQGDHYKKTYGLNKFSVLNTLRYYYVGGLPPDAILEGVLQYFVKELLKMFIFEKKYWMI